MKSEFHRRTVVKPGGHIEVTVTELRDGEKVEVVVRCESVTSSNGKRPGFGSARGKIRMANDFNAPIADFDDYV